MSNEDREATADDSLFENSFRDLNVNDDDDEGRIRTEDEYAQETLTLRAIVSSKEAGVIIGKAGKHVADLRDETGVKAGVSKVVPGVHDRVLTVTGALEGVSRAYAMVAATLLESPLSNPMSTATSIPAGQHPIRLLISHNHMGTIIGQKGFKIKHIQDVSGARMVASKEMLPQSTERIVEVQGDANSIRLAIWEIGKCLVDDWQRATGTVLYDPLVRSQGSELEGSAGTGGRMRPGNGGMGGDRYQERGSRGSYTRTGNGADFSDHTSSYRRTGAPTAMRTSDRSPSAPGQPMVSEDGEEYQTQNISIPADMVGCIIGRQGSKIQEIRRNSGAKISIAKAAHDESGERLFTLTGTPAANEKALYFLYENLEAEKIRRSNQGSPGHE
ncbi:hypothetical protein DFP73DRAFT_525205 [Morchella snyderi]|nr:hypothetical protein DFP73DRAFT_525205 [Morchella snyderi]